MSCFIFIHPTEDLEDKEMIRRGFILWAKETCLRFKEVSAAKIKAPGIIYVDHEK